MTNDPSTHNILREIDALLKTEVLPVSNDRLAPQTNILESLITLKNQGLISGDIVRIGVSAAPHRMTNIKLTYLGLKALRG
ncbi:MAG TPA: hypothetical protein VJX67_02195 [Blastocatellia bacterium]|nr:hypothetical protein [Blastocatellia bacterium]